MKKLVKANDLTYTREQFASALTIVIGNRILKPNITANSYCIIVEYNIPNGIKQKRLRQVISKENAALVLDYMHSASKQGGTGWRASINGVPIAVKTGTAQMANKNGTGYSDSDFVASCIGIFPSDDPKIILYLACVRPIGKTYGEVIAAPAISQVANEIIDYLGMARENAPSVEHSGKIVIKNEEENVEIKDVMPSLIGKSKRQLLNVIKDKRYKIILNGEGYVYKQTPKSGTHLKEGDEIELYLR